MVIYLINIIAALILTAFSLGIMLSNTGNAMLYIIMFLGWYTLAWLLSFFYNKPHFYKVPKIVGLILYFLKELMLASIKVAYDILTPRNHMKPALVAIPLDVKSDLEITLLANLITLTPGTLSIDISKNKKMLLIHEVYVKDNDIEEVKKTIKEGFERRILNITR
jgi:multicomponent Na+:H+ antiporter subunit E